MRGEPDSDPGVTAALALRARVSKKLEAASKLLAAAAAIMAPEDEPVACVAEGYVQSARMAVDAAVNLLS